MWKDFMFVGLGGVVGSVLRYGCTLVGTSLGFSSQVSTLCINILGSLTIGFITAHCQSNQLLLFATVGICGSFTTFSTFSLQVFNMLQCHKYASALTYMALSCITCILCAWLGFQVGNLMKR